MINEVDMKNKFRKQKPIQNNNYILINFLDLIEQS